MGPYDNQVQYNDATPLVKRDIDVFLEATGKDCSNAIILMHAFGWEAEQDIYITMKNILEVGSEVP